jgi:hypothetical protein
MFDHLHCYTAAQVDLVTWVILLVVAFANTIRDVIVDATHDHSSHADKAVDKAVDKTVEKTVSEAAHRALAEAAGATKTASTAASNGHGISGGAAVKSFIAIGWCMFIAVCIFYFFARRSELLLLKKVRVTAYAIHLTTFIFKVLCLCVCRSSSATMNNDIVLVSHYNVFAQCVTFALSSCLCRLPLQCKSLTLCVAYACYLYTCCHYEHTLPHTDWCSKHT